MIEEVKKILRKVANVGGTDAIVKMENMETYLDIKAQQICQLEKPDRPELRERIERVVAYWIAEERYGFGDITQEDWDGLTECERQSAWQNAEVLTNQILPDIYCPHPEVGVTVDGCDECPMVEEAKREERERIIMLLPKIAMRGDHNKTCFDCVERIKRQALKEQEKEV